MSDKVKIFIIGLLLGAVITTGISYLYISNNSSDCSSNNMQMNGGTPPEMPSGQNGQPPEKPDGDSQPPEMQNNN